MGRDKQNGVFQGLLKGNAIEETSSIVGHTRLARGFKSLSLHHK